MFFVEGNGIAAWIAKGMVVQYLVHFQNNSSQWYPLSWGASVHQLN
jgi:hypothetical protein